MIKKIVSSITLGALLIGTFGNGVANATNNYILAKGFMTYPITDNSLGVLANEPVDSALGVSMKFVMKNDSGVNLCAEEKSIPVVNGIFSYKVGSQYIMSESGVKSGCNINSLSPDTNYTIEYTADINKNGSYSDTIDFSGTLEYKASIDAGFNSSFLDAKTFSMQDSIISGVNISGDGGNSGNAGASATANIEYNISAGALNTQLISSGFKTKTFDLDGDSVAEVFSVKDGMGTIYAVNKVTGSYENIYSSALITLENATNLFVSGKYGNFILHGTFSIDSSTTLTNIVGTSISMKNGMVSEVNQSIKEFTATSVVVINLGGKDTSFEFNPLARQYEEKVSITLGGTSNLYGDVTSGNWAGTPFAGSKADYYAGEVREAEVNGTTVSDIDGVVYGDFNADNKLDFISYKNASGGKAYFSIHMETASGQHMKVLDSVLGDGITAGVSLLDNSVDFGTDVNEIIITNGKTKSVYKLNGDWESSEVGLGNDKTMSLIATFDSTFYAILGNEGGTINKNETYLSIGDKFRDMNDSNINDKFLVIGNFKVNKDGYDYYDYYLKKFNGTEFVDLLNESGKAIKFTGNKIGFQKIAVSDFYVFYIDQSTNYTKGKQDKTDLYYIHTNTVLPIMTNVIVNNNNTVITQDGINNEGGIKLLKNSTFGFFGINLEGIGSGFLGIDENNYISGNNHGYIQYHSDNRNYYEVNNQSIININNHGLMKIDSIFSKLSNDDGVVIDLEYYDGLKDQLYDEIKDIKWGIGGDRSFEIGNNVYKIRGLISDYISKEDYSNNAGLKIFYKTSTELGILSNNIKEKEALKIKPGIPYSEKDFKKPYEKISFFEKDYTFLKEDLSFNKILQYNINNDGIGFVNNSILAENGGEILIFLDRYYFMQNGKYKIVYGNKNWDKFNIYDDNFNYFNFAPNKPLYRVNDTITLRDYFNAEAGINSSNGGYSDYVPYWQDNWVTDDASDTIATMYFSWGFKSYPFLEFIEKNMKNNNKCKIVSNRGLDSQYKSRSGDWIANMWSPSRSSMKQVRVSSFFTREGTTYYSFAPAITCVGSIKLLESFKLY